MNDAQLALNEFATGLANGDERDRDIKGDVKLILSTMKGQMNPDAYPPARWAVAMLLSNSGVCRAMVGPDHIRVFDAAVDELMQKLTDEGDGHPKIKQLVSKLGSMP